MVDAGEDVIITLTGNGGANKLAIDEILRWMARLNKLNTVPG